MRRTSVRWVGPLVRGGLNESQISGEFSASRYSLRTTGRVGSATSMKRAPDT